MTRSSRRMAAVLFLLTVCTVLIPAPIGVTSPQGQGPVGERLDAGSGVTQVRETVRVLMPDGSVRTMYMDDYLKGVGGYSGGDIWIDLPVQVETPGDEPYQARMKCRLTQSWVIVAGSRVPVRFDPSNPLRVVLNGDLQALLRGRPSE